MQIREQGRKVQCIRSVYDPAVQRSHQKVVASFSRYTTTMPTTGLDELTDLERTELENWLAVKRDQYQSASRAHTARSAEQWLGELTASIAANEPAMTPEKATAIWKGIGDVAKALRKAGHPKLKAVRKAASDPAPTERAPVKKLPKPIGQGRSQAKVVKTVSPARTPKDKASKA
jgi:hypothetical protein